MVHLTEFKGLRMMKSAWTKFANAYSDGQKAESRVRDVNLLHDLAFRLALPVPEMLQSHSVGSSYPDALRAVQQASAALHGMASRGDSEMQTLHAALIDALQDRRNFLQKNKQLSPENESLLIAANAGLTGTSPKDPAIAESHSNQTKKQYELEREKFEAAKAKFAAEQKKLEREKEQFKTDKQVLASEQKKLASERTSFEKEKSRAHMKREARKPQPSKTNGSSSSSGAEHENNHMPQVQYAAEINSVLNELPHTLASILKWTYGWNGDNVLTAQQIAHKTNSSAHNIESTIRSSRLAFESKWEERFGKVPNDIFVASASSRMKR